MLKPAKQILNFSRQIYSKIISQTSELKREIYRKRLFYIF